MTKPKEFTKVQVFLDNGYRWDLFIEDDILDSVSSDFTDAIKNESDTFWLGNWGDSIEAHLYTDKGRHIEMFRESTKEPFMPMIIMKNVVTALGL